MECWDEGDWQQPYLTSAKGPDPRSDETITRELLRWLSASKATATFFVTARFLERYPEAVREIHEAGHEIGTHGPRHLRLPQQTPEGFRADLRMQGEQLETLIGIKPSGYRAPHFSLSKETTWILPILVEEGYTYDSSQFAAQTPEYGNEQVANEPYSLQIVAGPLLEIPVPGLPFIFGKRLPFAGGIYFRVLPLSIFRRFIIHLAKTCQPSLYLHQHELNPHTPRLTRGPFFRRFFKYYGVNQSFAKLKRLTDDMEFVSIASIFSSLSCKP